MSQEVKKHHEHIRQVRYTLLTPQSTYELCVSLSFPFQKRHYGTCERFVRGIVPSNPRALRTKMLHNIQHGRRQLIKRDHINRRVYFYIFIALIKAMVLPHDLRSEALAMLNIAQHPSAQQLDGTSPARKCSLAG